MGIPWAVLTVVPGVAVGAYPASMSAFPASPGISAALLMSHAIAARLGHKQPLAVMGRGRMCGGANGDCGHLMVVSR